MILAISAGVFVGRPAPIQASLIPSTIPVRVMEGQTQLTRILEAMGSKDRRLRIRPITACFVVFASISPWTKR